jgi:hypothetical protein
MKKIHKFGKEMKRSKKSDKRSYFEMSTLNYYYLGATRRISEHQIL